MTAEGVASYADVTPLDQEWTWEGYIPAGTVTLVGGDSGIGKGQLLSDIAARVSTGREMPDGTPGPAAGHVIMITPEDDPNTTTVRRLMAAGADLERVHDLTVVAGNIFSIQDDVNQLRRAMTACGGVRLVIIDPISAVTLVGLTSDVVVRRKVIGPLMAVARETGAAIVVVGHLTKAGTAAAARNRSAAKDGMGGSKGLTSTVRMFLSVTRDDADPRIRTLAVVKSNGTDDRMAVPVRFTVTGEGAGTHVQYLGCVAAAGPQGRSESDEAALMDILEAVGVPVVAQELANAAGVEYGAARMALARLAAAGRVVALERNMFAAAQDVAALPDAWKPQAITQQTRGAWPNAGGWTQV